jgi:hypothetical protein
MRLKSITVAAIVALTFMLSSAVCFGQNRGPSTPEERAQALRIARALEANPLDEKAKKAREWLLYWLIEVPDIHINLCTGFLEPLYGKKDKNYSSEIVGQMMFSTAAFIIEHPDKEKDDEATYQAGLEGSLRAYESILKTKPNARWPFLDDLIARREKGELGAYVQDILKQGKCKPGRN